MIDHPALERLQRHRWTLVLVAVWLAKVAAWGWQNGVWSDDWDVFAGPATFGSNIYFWFPAFYRPLWWNLARTLGPVFWAWWPGAHLQMTLCQLGIAALLAAILRRWGAGRRAAGTAAILFIVYPFASEASFYVSNTLNSWALLPAAAALFVAADNLPRRSFAAQCGLVAALIFTAALSYEQPAALAPVAALWLLWREAERRNRPIHRLPLSRYIWASLPCLAAVLYAALFLLSAKLSGQTSGRFGVNAGEQLGLLHYFSRVWIKTINLGFGGKWFWSTLAIGIPKGFRVMPLAGWALFTVALVSLGLTLRRAVSIPGGALSADRRALRVRLMFLALTILVGLFCAQAPLWLTGRSFMSTRNLYTPSFVAMLGVGLVPLAVSAWRASAVSRAERRLWAVGLFGAVALLIPANIAELWQYRAQEQLDRRLAAEVGALLRQAPGRIVVVHAPSASGYLQPGLTGEYMDHMITSFQTWSSEDMLRMVTGNHAIRAQVAGTEQEARTAYEHRGDSLLVVGYDGAHMALYRPDAPWLGSPKDNR